MENSLIITSVTADKDIDDQLFSNVQPLIEYTKIYYSSILFPAMHKETCGAQR